jgi:hypothetical protein
MDSMRLLVHACYEAFTGTIRCFNVFASSVCLRVKMPWIRDKRTIAACAERPADLVVLHQWLEKDNPRLE